TPSARSQGKMDEPETLIAEYKLETWGNPSYTGTNPVAKSQGIRATTYRGYLRKTPRASRPAAQGTLAQEDAVFGPCSRGETRAPHGCGHGVPLAGRAGWGLGSPRPALRAGHSAVRAGWGFTRRPSGPDWGYRSRVMHRVASSPVPHRVTPSLCAP